MFGDYTEDYVKLHRSYTKETRQTYIDKNPSADILISETVNGNGLLISSKNAEGHTTTYGYDDLGRMVNSRDARLLYTYNVYNSKGQLDYTQTSDGIVTSYGYDTNTGEMIAEFNDDNKSTRYAYDSMGRVTNIWGHVPNPVKFTYDATKDPLGRKTRMDTYRTGSNWAATTKPSDFNGSGDKTEWEYDAYSGLLETKRDAADTTSTYVYTYAYDKLGRVTTRTDARGVAITQQYHAAINPVTDDYPGALYKVLYPSPYNSTSDYGYTPDLTYNYYRHGALKSVQEGSVTTRTFSYNDHFQLTQENLGAFNGNKTLNYSYETSLYGFKGRLAAFNLVNDSTYKNSYTYDGTGRLDKVTANHTSVSAFDYTYHPQANVVDYLQSGNYKMNPVFKSNSYKLDKIFHQWGTSKTQETRFTYDDLGRRVEEKSKGDLTNSLGYPSLGIVSDNVYTDRNEVEYKARFEMNSSWNATTAVAGSDLEYYYDPMGNRTSRETEQPMGTALSETYTSNNLNQYTKSPETIGYTHTYDDNGNLTFDGRFYYTYDAENRLTRTIGVWGWGDVHYKYDYLGRRTEKSAQKFVNALIGKYYNETDWSGYHHRQNDSQVNFNWGTGAPSGIDPDTFRVRWIGYIEAPQAGNYTIYGTADDGTGLYVDGKWVYSGAGSRQGTVHLKKGVKHHIIVDQWEYTGSAYMVLEWSGPGLSRQVVPSANLWSQSVTQWEETRYIYEGWNLIAETNGSHTIGRKFTWGLDASNTLQGAGGVRGLLMIQDGTSEYFPIYDGSGNVAGLFDEYGNIDAAYEYDSFGRITKQTGPYADKNPFRFSTKYTDEETGMVYFGYRYYSPQMGRFINQDPIEESGGINLYGMLGNDPVNYYDYLGLISPPDTANGSPSFWEAMMLRDNSASFQPRNVNFFGPIMIERNGIYNHFSNGDGSLFNSISSGSRSPSYSSNTTLVSSAFLVPLSSPDQGFGALTGFRNGDFYEFSTYEVSSGGGFELEFESNLGYEAQSSQGTITNTFGGTLTGNNGSSLTTHNAIKNPQNGSYSWSVTINVPAGSNGLAIQKIDRKYNVLDANGNPVQSLDPKVNGATNVTYFEAWEVKNGQVGEFKRDRREFKRDRLRNLKGKRNLKGTG